MILFGSCVIGRVKGLYLVIAYFFRGLFAGAPEEKRLSLKPFITLLIPPKGKYPETKQSPVLTTS